MIRTTRWNNISTTILIMILLFCITIGTPGCLRTIQKSIDHEDEIRESSGIPGADSSMGLNGILVESAEGITTENQGKAEVLVEKSLVVSEVPPILPEDPYPVLHGARLHQVPDRIHDERILSFSKTYSFRGNATGLLVDVDQPPLIITFSINPQYDCIKSPASCRGSYSRPINRPYFTMTIRNNQTGETVLQDGYGREFSSETSNRTVKIYQQGIFHITLAGEFLDVNFGIATGSSPLVSEMNEKAGTVAPYEGPVTSENDQYWY